ncbi:EthD family reductase [Pseudonocardia alni]|uniref:EthD family reductase n=1 Tax=Pseudonocardia alni TaxID=33907 RepID=UPI00280C3BC9|nr:EthD family reductase [Pseudonocardia alni]
MHILTVAYGHPSVPTEFDLHYETVHKPLALQLPEIRQLQVSRCSGIEGSQPPFYVIAELSFDSVEALQKALASPEGQAAAEDVETFADGGVTLFLQHR